MSVGSSNGSKDLQYANFQNLVLAQKLLQDSPFSARHVLGITEKEAEFITNLSPSELSRLANTDLMLFSFRFNDRSLGQLRDFIEGDNLALTHLHLNACSAPQGVQHA